LAPATDGPFTGAWVARSGARLRAVHLVLTGTDHASFAYFHDTALGLDCTFRLARDGHVRCLPVELVLTPASEPGCDARGWLVPATCTTRVTSHDGTTSRCEALRSGVRRLVDAPEV